MFDQASVRKEIRARQGYGFRSAAAERRLPPMQPRITTYGQSFRPEHLALPVTPPSPPLQWREEAFCAAHNELALRLSQLLRGGLPAGGFIRVTSRAIVLRILALTGNPALAGCRLRLRGTPGTKGCFVCAIRSPKQCMPPNTCNHIRAAR